MNDDDAQFERDMMAAMAEMKKQLKDPAFMHDLISRAFFTHNPDPAVVYANSVLAPQFMPQKMKDELELSAQRTVDAWFASKK